MKIVIIDGQGGKMGKSVIEQLKKRFPELETYAIGTNSIATSAMLKAGNLWGNRRESCHCQCPGRGYHHRPHRYCHGQFPVGRNHPGHGSLHRIQQSI